MWKDYLGLWENTARRMMGEDVAPLATPQKDDRRFKDAAWEENEVFNFIKQSYLLTSCWVRSTAADVEGLDEETGRKVDFYTRQFVDALSPSNFAMTNPEVLRATIDSRGENLIRGIENLLDDLEQGQRSARNPYDGPERLRCRTQRRRFPGQGGVPERPDGTDPIRADHSDRLPTAASHHPAVDQQVLHPRPARE